MGGQVFVTVSYNVAANAPNAVPDTITVIVDNPARSGVLGQAPLVSRPRSLGTRYRGPSRLPYGGGRPPPEPDLGAPTNKK